MEAKRLSHTLTYVLDLSKAIHAQLGSRARCSWVRFFLGINVNTLLFQVLTPLFWHSVPDQVQSTYVLGVLCTWSIQRLNATLFFAGMGLTSFPRCLIFPPSRSEIFSFAPGGREISFPGNEVGLRHQCLGQVTVTVTVKFCLRKSTPK